MRRVAQADPSFAVSDIASNFYIFIIIILFCFVFLNIQDIPSKLVTFSIGFKLVTLNLTFGKRLANVYVLCRHIFDV